MAKASKADEPLLSLGQHYKPLFEGGGDDKFRPNEIGIFSIYEQLKRGTYKFYLGRRPIENKLMDYLKDDEVTTIFHTNDSDIPSNDTLQIPLPCDLQPPETIMAYDPYPPNEPIDPDYYHYHPDILPMPETSERSLS